MYTSKQFAATAVSFTVCIVTSPALADDSATFSPYVNEKGDISRPKDFATAWAHLGSVASTNKLGEDVASVHSVYTQPEVMQTYQKTGKFPDGAVLVKEIRTATTSEMATGRVAHQDVVDVWFVMIKDTKGRFKTNPHWGNGWGWALYEAKKPDQNVSKGFRQSCIGCHTPAKSTDWVNVNI